MKKTIYFFLFYVCFCANTVNAQVNVQDSLALVDLYDSTDGSHWFRHENWKSGPVATWVGITVKNTRVTEIVLQDNNLMGSIPSSIGNLTNLEYLNLFRNKLSGKIPSSIANLTNLQSLVLDANNLSGNIPSSIGNLINLKILSLDGNKLSGKIPSSIGNLTNLQALDLPGNQLSGSFPSSIGNLINLQYIHLEHGNHLSGDIPSSIGNLTNLLTLDLENNQLSGSIPSTIGNLANLRSLILLGNKLSGSIPSSLTHLNNLNNGDLLILRHNYFTFDGMEAIAQKFSKAAIDHQKNIRIHQSGNTLSVSAGGTLSNNTYKWYKCEGTTATLVATITGDSVFHPSESGRYYVRVKNSVIGQRLKLFSSAFDYTASNNNVIASSENSLQQYNKANLFRVYPNPVKDILYVETNSNATFSLINQSGKILVTTSINAKGSINISDMSAGLYYLKNNKTGTVQKIMIVR